LEVDYCGFALVYVVATSTIVATNCITMDVAQQWALLTKKQEFLKPKSCIITIWAFFASITTSFSKVSLSSNKLNELKYVIYYLFAPITRLKKGMIAYKMANRFMHFKHIEIFHWQIWNEWIE
jgi:hypothetical protein